MLPRTAIRLIGAALALAIPTDLVGAQDLPSESPGQAITHEQARDAALRGHLFLIKGFIKPTGEQESRWAVFEAAVFHFEKQGREFLHEYCATAKEVDPRTNLSAAAQRMHSQTLLIDRRAQEMRQLQIDADYLRESLTPEQVGGYQNLSRFLFHDLIDAPGIAPETGLPRDCAPLAPYQPPTITIIPGRPQAPAKSEVHEYRL